MNTFWSRADSEDPALRGDEARLLEHFQRLVDVGILRQGEDLAEVECDACGEAHLECVVWIAAPPGSEPRAYIPCPVAGRVSVKRNRMEVWTIGGDGIAQMVADMLGLTTSPRPLTEDRLWLLGTRRLAELNRDVFIVRGVEWPDSNQLLVHPRLQASTRPLVLVPDQLPAKAEWKCNGRLFQAMSELDWFADKPHQVLQVLSSRIAAAEANVPSGSLFRREGPVWTVRFEGITAQVIDVVGMGYIAELLRRPQTWLDATTLVAIDNGSAYAPLATDTTCPAAAAMPGIEVTDAQALRTVKAELRRKKNALNETKLPSSSAKEKLEGEIAQLHAYLDQAQGRRGLRKAGGLSERARSRVTHAIDRAISGIAKQHLTLANHLEKSITTGSSFAYMPLNLPDWHF